MNIRNAASCPGNVTRWNVCYYSADSNATMTSYFAIYRPTNGSNYLRIGSAATYIATTQFKTSLIQLNSRTNAVRTMLSHVHVHVCALLQFIHLALYALLQILLASADPRPALPSSPSIPPSLIPVCKSVRIVLSYMYTEIRAR